MFRLLSDNTAAGLSRKRTSDSPPELRDSSRSKRRKQTNDGKPGCTAEAESTASSIQTKNVSSHSESSDLHPSLNSQSHNKTQDHRVTMLQTHYETQLRRRNADVKEAIETKALLQRKLKTHDMLVASCESMEKTFKRDSKSFQGRLKRRDMYILELKGYLGDANLAVPGPKDGKGPLPIQRS